MIKITRSPELLTETIETAQEFLWTVSFQLTDDSIIDALVKAESRGVDVRVITLPVDSYNDPSLREHLAAKHQQLTGISYCTWEVGDPSLTNSSQSGQQRGGGGDKWYSLHAKFIVSEKYALVLSKNLNQGNEWEAYYRSESLGQIRLFQRKFTQAHNLFCAPSDTDPHISGQLFDNLDSKLQRNLSETNRFLVPGYSADLIPIDTTLSEGLWLTPFDAVARLLIYQLFDHATKFIWIAGETLTDSDLVKKIQARKLNTPDLDVRIIAGGLPRDVGRRIS